MTNNLNVSNTYKQFLTVQNVQLSSAPINADNCTIAAVQIKDTEKEKKGHALTKAVAIVAISGAAIGLLFTKGISSKFYKNINSWMQKLDDKIYEYSTNHKTLSAVQRGYLKLTEGLRNILGWFKTGNNITAARDAGFMALCDKIGLGKPMHWITNQFKKITISTSQKAYERARNVTDANIAKLRALIPQLREVNPREAAELEKLLTKLDTEISQIANATSRANRLATIEEMTKNVGVQVTRDFGVAIRNPNRKNLERLRLDRTEVHSSKGRELLQNELKEAQRGFTFNISDKSKIMGTTADEVGRVLLPEDKVARNLLRQLRKQIKEYSKLSGNTETTDRARLVPEMQKLVETLTSTIQQGKYSDESKTLICKNLGELKEVLDNNNGRGTIEHILGILGDHYKTQSPKVYNQAKSLTDEIRNVTNKAFENEMKLYDKFAEYSVGSAPTDVLGMVLPAGLAAYAISKGDDKDAKISATLKSGIPILGGVATTFVAAAKMMSNMQGLALGALSTFVLNAIGSKADEGYKQYRENNLFAQKAIAAYKSSGNV